MDLNKLIWLNMHRREPVVFRFPFVFIFPRFAEFEGALFSFAVAIEKQEPVYICWDDEYAYRHQDKNWRFHPDDIPF